MKSPIQNYLEALHRELVHERGGQLASYIPELARVDPEQFGICLVTMDGVCYSVGDADTPFTIQSISKAFVYAAALADRGQEYVASKVGVEPSGDAFNSISLHPHTGAPLNPMINAGAIASTSIVAGATPQAQWQRIEAAMASFIGHEVEVDEAVFRSESETGHRNRAISWMLKNFDIVEGDPMAKLENYFRQCSVLVTCRDLAYMAATLANNGTHPLSRARTLPSEYVERVLGVMATCGMYDYAGSWLYEVGMPAKSGVGGGIIAVLPGRFGIGVFSPRLDEKGNSVRGIAACKRLSRDIGLNIFSCTSDPSVALGRMYTAASAPSRRQQGSEANALLKDQAHRIKYLSLNGYLAVDGIEYVIRQMLTLASDTHSFILDMHQVIGISESAARLLNQARIAFRDPANGGVAVTFSRIHNRPAISAPLSKTAGTGLGFLSFEDNDLAVEWCENRLLGELAAAAARTGQLKDARLFKDLPENLLQELEAVGTHQLYRAGTPILVSGEESDGRIFFIQSGQVSILVPLDDGANQRISTLGTGVVFGEMTLLGAGRRSASVFADMDTDCIVFAASDLDRISTRDPRFRIGLLENLASELADKLRIATQWIAALA
ncbi:MAG: glutaminase A [Moraxellaceae bacterium]|nr:glutaminase A [Moraxellaceae bacterium]